MPRTQRAPEDARSARQVDDGPLFDETPTPAAPAAPAIGRNVPVDATSAVPVLQWANGKPQAQRAGATRFTALIGWHCEAGQDAALDAALAAADAERITIKHQRPGGSEQISHWYLGESLRVYPVTSGPVAFSLAHCLRQSAAMAEAGIGLRWPAGDRSRMAVRVFVEPLLAHGYTTPLALSVRSRMSDVLLGALLAHGQACEAADALIDRARHVAPVTFHELALPLGPGDEEEWGKGDTATVVPFRALHPTPIDATYLRTIWRPQVVQRAAYEAWPQVLAWAAAYAAEREDAPVWEVSGK